MIVRAGLPEGSTASSPATHEHDITLHTEIRAGHPAQELLRVIRDQHADLLILGRSGYSAIWGRFIGTTPEKVARHLGCSALIAT